VPLSIRSTPNRYRLKYAERFLGNALDRDPSYDTASVSPMLEGVRPGDPVTCRVRQEIQPMGSGGTSTTVKRCWR
jgi:hypothetical protein